MTEIVAGGLLLVISHRLPFFFAFLNCLPSSARRLSFSVSACSVVFRLAKSLHRSQAILYRPTLVNLISSIKVALHIKFKPLGSNVFS